MLPWRNHSKTALLWRFFLHNYHSSDNNVFLTYNKATKHRWLQKKYTILAQCLLVGCLTSQKHASASQGRIFWDNFTCCHTEIEVADQTFYLNLSQYTDTGPTNPSTDPITPGAWQGSHRSANFEVTGMTRPGKNRDSNAGSSAPEADTLTTRPARRWLVQGL